MQPDEYRKMAEVEDTMWYYRALHRHVERSLTAVLPAGGARVLDAGCGTGGLLCRLHATRPEWVLTGLDLSPLAVGRARGRAGGEIVQGSIAALPFADAQFDAIVSCDVVCQVADPTQAVREIHRCLRPGGFVVLTMPAYQWMYSYHDREVGNLRRYSRGEVNTLLGDAGLAVRHNTYWNTLPFPLAVVRRKLLPPAAPASDVRLFPAPVEAGFNALMAVEHAWLGAGGRLPVGNSVLTVAQKSQQSGPHTP
ncbi:class I SAM-dependent methyltransferase [Opitutus sp. GAS368]|uniref:class I SAM-dependent methyltransferase n=1 Tax=Opitutus sp. GAS368 TaxID=1882749 RepID=UPI00087D400B|nr:class I SAM-dependent methyltransferase [Opitutus sp. GAS368]SDS24658.1 Methyltransferase domain-containing protein [Opitutus sp. GAS368]